MSDEHTLLTYADAGRIAGVDRATIREWVEGGHLAAWPMPNSTRKRIRKKTLLRFIEEREFCGSSGVVREAS